jgi:hypothetical protein
MVRQKQIDPKTCGGRRHRADHDVNLTGRQTTGGEHLIDAGDSQRGCG